MSEDQKYHELLKEIGRIIKEKNDEIVLRNFQNADLRKQLAKAEKELEETKKGK